MAKRILGTYLKFLEVPRGVSGIIFENLRVFLEICGLRINIEQV
jgi:hypothetical protein